MDDELDAFDGGHTDLKQACGMVGSNEHREVVVGEVDRADRVAVGVEDVVVSETWRRAL